EASRALHARLLVGDTDLERPVARMRPDVPPQPRVVAPGDRRLPVGPAPEDRRSAATWELAEPPDPRRAAAGVSPLREGGVGRERDQRRQPRQHALERPQACLLARHPHMYVEPADELAVDRVAELGDHLLVARLA